MTSSSDWRVYWPICSGIIRPFFLNLKILHQRIWVRWISLGYRVSRYLQPCISNKIYTIRSWVREISQCIVKSSNIFQRKDSGSAFCFLLFLSILLYHLHCSWRRNQVLPSISSWESGLSISLKDWFTYDRVASTIDWTRDFLFWWLKVASLTARAKAERAVFLWNDENSSRNRYWSRLTLSKKLFQQRQAATHLALVSPTVASARASSVAVIHSTKNLAGKLFDDQVFWNLFRS